MVCPWKSISLGLSSLQPSTKKSIWRIMLIKRNSRIRIAPGVSSRRGLSSPRRLVSQTETGSPIVWKLFMVILRKIRTLKLKHFAGVQNISFVHRGWNFESLVTEAGGEVRNKVDILRHRVKIYHCQFLTHFCNQGWRK